MPTPLPAPLARRPLLVVALLAATLFALLPAVASAQPQPPALIIGTIDSVTIDGAPWDDSLIQVINAADEVLATVVRDGDKWYVDVPNDAGPVRFRAANGSLSEEFEFEDSQVETDFVLVIGGAPRATRDVALLPGWNWVVWTGHTQAIGAALEAFPDLSQLTVIFERPAETQRWQSYRPGLPAIVNRIAELRSGVSYFLRVDSAMTWEMPVDGDLTGTRLIANGFTAIGWVGPDGTPQDVLDAIANPAAIAAFFRWNAAIQDYESYRPGFPAFVNKISSIQPFDVLFTSATAPTTITQ